MKLEKVENVRAVFGIINYFIFIAADFAMIDLLNDDMSWELFNIAGIWFLIRDVLFIIATLVNLYIDKNTKWIYMDIFSMLLIIILVVVKIFAISYPNWLLVFWCLYVWNVCVIRILFDKK